MWQADMSVASLGVKSALKEATKSDDCRYCLDEYVQVLLGYNNEQRFLLDTVSFL